MHLDHPRALAFERDVLKAQDAKLAAAALAWARNRDTAGRFDVEDFSPVCVCGHTLGEHSAMRNPRTKRKDCFAGDTTGTPCECTGYRKARR